MKLHYPLNGIGTKPGIYLTQKFGGNAANYSQFGMRGHNGIDWGAPAGTPILAAQDGQAVYAQDPGGYGNYARVYFDEEGFTYDTVYAHMSRFEGGNRKVKAGDVIGYVGTTGYSSGNHLHFGLRKLLNGSVVDYNNGYLGYFDPQPHLEESMNQAKIVLGKDGMTVYIAYPVPSEQHLKERTSLEGITIPNQIPKASEAL